MGTTWITQAQEAVSKELPGKEHDEAVGNVCAAIKSGVLPIVALVTSLQPFLTDQGPNRARGIALLAEVLTAAPKAAGTDSEVHHLAEFFTARLTDWPAIHGALQGCLALLSRPHSSSSSSSGGSSPAPSSPLPPLASADATAMLHACTGHVFVRSLAQPERSLALQLLEQSVRQHGQALLDDNVDLLEWAIASVDGEKDPRCLVAAFRALRELLRLYHQQPETSLHLERLEDSVDELFDIVACYFPISFTPPPDSPHQITRAQLTGELEATLTASPLFAHHLLPLLLEKLSSSLRQAKLDSLSALGAAAEVFTPGALADHNTSIWGALRTELLAPAAGNLLDPEVRTAEEMAAAAAACLARCVAAQQRAASGGSSALAAAALGDASMQDLEVCVRSPGVDDAAFRRSVLRVSALSRVLAALVEAGGAAARRSAALLPPILEPAGSVAADAGTTSACLAWAVIVGVLKAAASSGTVLDPAVVQLIAAEAAAGAASVQPGGGNTGSSRSSSPVDGGGEGEEQQAPWSTAPEAYTLERAVWLQLTALETLFQSPQLAALLQRDQVDAGLGAILAHIAAASSSRQPTCRQATAALCALARGTHSAAVRQCALAELLAAATGQHVASQGGALAALQALASATSELQAEVVIALDDAIQISLAAAGGGSPEAPSSGSLAVKLLESVSAILLATAPTQQQAAHQAGLLAQHLVAAVVMLSPSGAAAVSQDASLVGAAGHTAFYAARVADAASQGTLAAAAVAALLAPAASSVQMAVCSAALAPLASAALSAARLPGDDGLRTAQLLVVAAVGSTTSEAASRFAALGAAALLNKAAGDAADHLGECVEGLLSQQLLPAACAAQAGSSEGSSSIRARTSGQRAAAWHALAAVVQALAMRGHPQADAILSWALGRLEASAAAAAAVMSTATGTASSSQAAPPLRADGVHAVGNGMASGMDGITALLAEQDQAADGQAAAAFLQAVLAVDSSPGAVALNQLSHAVAKPLWQQRLYTKASSQLLSALQASLQGSSSGGGSRGTGSSQAAQAEQQQQQAPPVLLLALGQLLRGAPGNVVALDMPRLLPWVLHCLGALHRGPWAEPQLLHFLLRLVSEFLVTEQGQQEVEGALSRLVPTLLDLALWRPSMAVRSSALQCLVDLAQLPYHSLHPYCREVVKAAAAACDDAKRTVRLQAAHVRQAWSE